jgi:hypothetical protein
MATHLPLSSAHCLTRFRRTGTKKTLAHLLSIMTNKRRGDVKIRSRVAFRAGDTAGSRYQVVHQPLRSQPRAWALIGIAGRRGRRRDCCPVSRRAASELLALPMAYGEGCPAPGTAWRRYGGGLGPPTTAWGLRWRGGHATGTPAPQWPASFATPSRPTSTSAVAERLRCRRAHSQRPPASLHEAGRDAGGPRRPLPR